MNYRLTLRLLPLAAMCVGTNATASTAEDSVAAQVRNLTETRTKLVWVRATPAAKSIDPGHRLYGETDGNQLVVLDTEEGKERILQAGPGSFANPLITRDGNQVIWSDITSNTIWIADWSGGNRRKVSDGDCAFALSTHWDAGQKREWVYAFDGTMVWAKMRDIDDEEKRDQLGNKKVFRFPLDKGPMAKELVYSGTHINTYFTVSADGKMAASVFPWPKVGILDIASGKIQFMSSGEDWGCWACISPDTSYRFFYFQGNHAKISMFDPGQTKPREIDVTSMPGNDGKRDAAAPRFANHARFLCIGTPLGVDDASPFTGDVYLGRFDANWTKIEKWVQVSHHPLRDVMLSAWLENGVIATTKR